MAIHLNDKTKLTARVEELLVELGGANPNKTLSRDELAKALVNAVNELHRQGKTHILEKIYLACQREDASLPSIGELRCEAETGERSAARVSGRSPSLKT